MALREIVLYPDEILREVAEPVIDITSETLSLIDDMVETMYDAPGIGLAAPQVGVSQRIIVLDVNPEKGSLLKLINPELHFGQERVPSEEACLSIPGIHETIPRFSTVTLRALTPEGTDIELEADGMLAICLQHEVDHLDGILFIDHLSKLKRSLLQSKLKKIARRD